MSNQEETDIQSEIPPYNPDVPFVNKDEVAEIEFIQQEIQMISRKVEAEKNDLALLKERYFLKQKEFNKLTGKPTNLSQEEKAEVLEQRRKRMQNRKISDQLESKKVRNDLADEENFKVQKQTAKIEVDLAFVTKNIDKNNMDNQKLMAIIENLRKEKVRISDLTKDVRYQNRKVQTQIDQISRRNEINQRKIKYGELRKVQEEGANINQSFIIDRDRLEKKYHHMIEESIKREREHKKEISMNRLKFAKMADNARKKAANKRMSRSNSVPTLMDEHPETLPDREPILNVLIDKWKETIKYKRKFVNKYMHHSKTIKEIFDKLVMYLGLDNYKQLPTIFLKNEEQLASIEKYNTGLGTEISKLEQEKKKWIKEE
ncbi:MAG: hypothetical protein MJ252_13315 [archaeon]|nr:hypothetical protein [archaeon]